MGNRSANGSKEKSGRQAQIGVFRPSATGISGAIGEPEKEDWRTDDGGDSANDRTRLANVRGTIPEELARQLSDEMPDCGIYFLMSGDICVYIGLTQEPHQRILCHKNRWKEQFDAVLWLAIEWEECHDEEKRLIGLICPKHNKKHNPNPDKESESWGMTSPNPTNGMVPLFVEISPGLRDALDILAERNVRKISGEVRLALENHTGYRTPRNLK